MPEMSGIELTKAIKFISPTVKVIIRSCDIKNIKSQAISVGADLYFDKFLSFDLLIKAIENLLDNKIEKGGKMNDRNRL